jgi:hypothetical protein
MRDREAELQETEGRNGIGEDDYKAAAFPTLRRKYLISKETNLHKNSLLVFKVEHQEVTMACILKTVLSALLCTSPLIILK